MLCDRCFDPLTDVILIKEHHGVVVAPGTQGIPFSNSSWIAVTCYRDFLTPVTEKLHNLYLLQINILVMRGKRDIGPVTRVEK